MKIAVSGKGGAGKTTLAACIVSWLAAQQKPVFAVDADPDANLGLALGLDGKALTSLQPLIELHDLIKEKNAGSGAFIDLNPDVSEIFEKFTLRQGPIRLIKMGAIKQGGSSCYCKENAFLNSILTNVLLDRPEAVVLDMSAGIEHLTRGTARGIHSMLVVVEPTCAGLSTALAVERLAGEINVPQLFFVGNKIRTETDRRFLLEQLPPERVAGMISFSEKALERARFADGGGFRPEDLLPGVEEVLHKIWGGGYP